MMSLEALYAIDQDFIWVDHLRHFVSPLLEGRVCEGSTETSSRAWLTRLELLLAALAIEFKLSEETRAAVLPG